MTYREIPRPTLDRWWQENQRQLADMPDDSHCLMIQLLLQNEYHRHGWEEPGSNTTHA